VLPLCPFRFGPMGASTRVVGCLRVARRAIQETASSAHGEICQVDMFSHTLGCAPKSDQAAAGMAFTI
jgi:hypothetical protein